MRATRLERNEPMNEPIVERRLFLLPNVRPTCTIHVIKFANCSALLVPEAPRP
jgi:hypothetical protein